MKLNTNKNIIVFLNFFLIFSFLIIYLPTLSFGYIADDFDLVPLSFEQALNETIRGPHFRPLWYLSYPAVNFILYNSSYLHHLTNICIHLVNCSISFLIFRRFLPDSVAILIIGIWSLLPWVAFPVAWISQRNDLLMAFFVLSAIHQNANRPWSSFILVFLAFLSKVTSLFFPLAFLLVLGLKRRNVDIIIGILIFTLCFLISYLALNNNVTQEHLNQLPALIKLINHTKNFLIGWLSLIVPLPFLFTPLNILGFTVLSVTLSYLISNHAIMTDTAKKYLLFSFLMSLPLAMTYELRITYLQSLFLLVALFSSLFEGFKFDTISHKTRFSLLCIVFLAFYSFTIPALIKTINNFKSQEYDITNSVVQPPNNGYYPNNFYSWFRFIQIQILKH